MTTIDERFKQHVAILCRPSDDDDEDMGGEFSESILRGVSEEEFEELPLEMYPEFAFDYDYADLAVKVTPAMTKEKARADEAISHQLVLFVVANNFNHVSHESITTPGGVETPSAVLFPDDGIATYDRDAAFVVDFFDLRTKMARVFELAIAYLGIPSIQRYVCFKTFKHTKPGSVPKPAVALVFEPSGDNIQVVDVVSFGNAPLDDDVSRIVASCPARGVEGFRSVAWRIPGSPNETREIKSDDAVEGLRGLEPHTLSVDLNDGANTIVFDLRRIFQHVVNGWLADQSKRKRKRDQSE